MDRFGITIPFDGAPLAAQRDQLQECADLGYTDFWSSEANGTDAFTPLAMAAAWIPDVRLGCAIVPAFTRGPALMAQSVAAMAEAAPGRFAFGIGTSSDVIVERWNGIPFEEPYQRTKDMTRFLKEAFTGEKVETTFDTFNSKGFRLGRRLKPDHVPPILIAALRPGMLRLAGRESEGAIINWLGADDVKKVVPEVQQGWRQRNKEGKPEVVARIFVCPTPDADVVRQAGKFAISSYLNVPVYAAFHEWLGNGDRLQPMWDAWKAGDKAALAAIPDSMVDDLIVHGTPEQCREHLQRYVDNGVTTPVLALMPFGIDGRQAIKDLAPAAAG
jgi:probable F420-dependent oxidoreductase